MFEGVAVVDLLQVVEVLKHRPVLFVDFLIVFLEVFLLLDLKQIGFQEIRPDEGPHSRGNAASNESSQVDECLVVLLILGPFRSHVQREVQHGV